MSAPLRKILGAVGLMAILIPVLGLFLGGIYSFPAIKLTRGRDPWLSLLLAAGLAITIFGIGLTGHLPLKVLTILWAVTVVLLLLARWFYGSLDHSLEYFGSVHIIALLLVFGAAAWLNVKSKAAAAHAYGKTPPHAAAPLHRP